MYDSWRSTDPAGPAAGPGTVALLPPTGQHPQLISSAWRIRNLSEIQATSNGSSAILEPEVAVAQDNSTNEGLQENDKMAPVVNSELGIGEEECEKMLNSSFSAFSSPSSSLPQPCDQNRQQDFFPQSIGSMESTPAARSQVLDSISDLRLVDETEAVRQRPSDGALPVSTGSRGISYTNGHVTTGSEVSDEKAGYMNLRHKSRRKPVQDRPRPKRQAARDMCRPLKQWLYCHRDTPYPTKAEKQDLAVLSRMTLTQVSNWFANARRRLKNTVSGPEVTWRRRIKLYNQFVVGNQELLSVSSDDTMWDEDDDDDDDEEEEREWKEGRMEGRGKDNVLNDSLPLYPLSRLTTATHHQMSSTLLSSLDASGRRHRLPLLTFDPEVVDLSSPATASSSGACCTPAAKFKQGILQRYLTDAYERVGQNGVKEGEEDEEGGYEETEGDGGAMEETEASRRRNRNGSGSLSSHDYEEEMSISARSTPTKEHQTNEEDDIAEDRGHSNTPSKFGSSNDPDDLYWMEISAALALTNLAMRSRLNSGSSHESSPRV